MEYKSSHEGHKMGEACGHLKRMHAEHGSAAGAGSKPQNENRSNRGMERKAERAERKDG